jgi:hypothetical protein
MRLFTCIGVAIALLLPSAAFAQTFADAAAATGSCRLRIDSSTTSWIVQNYDPFGLSDPSGTFDLMLTNEGSTRCQVYPQFVVDQESFGLSSGLARRAPYRLYDTFSAADVTPTSGRSIRTATARSVVIAPGGQQLVQYQLEVDGSQLQGDGTFTQQLAVEVQDTDGTPLAARRIIVGVNVLPSALLGLCGAFRMNNGQALVDIGELNQGLAPIPLQLRVKSTRAYTLNFMSRNNGALVLTGTQWAVPYSVRVGDRTLSLVGAATYASERAGRGIETESLPLEFVVGDSQNKRAGTYSDVLTVTIAPT